jgi:hypothetical protein
MLQQDLNNAAIQHVATHAGNQMIYLTFKGKSLGMIEFLKRIPFTLKKYKLFLPEDIMRKVVQIYLSS